MEHFYKPDVFRELGDRRKRINYLRGHYRYHTMNSWNNSISYANKVKIYNLPVDRDKAFGVIQSGAFWEDVEDIMDEFGREHDYEYHATFNGRSSGYIVLVKGGSRKDEKGDWQAYTTSGLGIDMGESFEEWDEYELAKRVSLVISFDKMCDRVLELLRIYCKSLTTECVIIEE
jgi:hypothetical protein